MMLGWPKSGQAEVTSGLAGSAVTEGPQGVCEVGPRDVPGKLHTAMISSLTK
jgi:hypothetical protein